MRLPGRIASRYIFRQTGGATLLILLSLTGIVWIALALRQLNLMTTQGQTIWMFIQLTVLALPNLMAIIAPVALLVATIHVLNRLNGDSELIVLTAAGGTIWTIVRPLLLLALLFSVMVSAVNHVVMPWSLQSLRDAVVAMRADLISQVIQPGKFSSPEANLTFHIRDRAPDGEITGILLQDARDEKESRTYLAEKGSIVKQGEATYLVMQKGHVVSRPRGEKAAEPPTIIAFESFPVDLDRFEKKLDTVELKPKERYWHQLVRPGAKDTLARQQPGLLRAELHERFASVLYPFVFVLVAAAFMGHAKTTRQNRVQSIVLAFLCAAGCRLGGLAANNLVALRPSALWLLYGLPIGAILLSLAGAQQGMRPQRRSRIVEPIVDGVVAAGHRLAALLPARWRRVESGGQ